MLVREMSRSECEELLARLGFGRLACARDNQPYIAPMYFAFEQGHIYGFATMGQKIAWMRLNPQVCVEADEVLSHNKWASVVVQGSYEEYPDIAEYEERRQQAQSMLEKVRSLWWQTGVAVAQTRPDFDRASTTFYCIHIKEISGRCASPDPVEHSWSLAES